MVRLSSLLLTMTVIHIVSELLQSHRGKSFAEDLKKQPQGRGVFPDYPVSYSITDLLNGRDKVMEMAKDIYNKRTQ